MDRVAGSDPLPRTIAPMKATAGELPTGDGWAYEIKWDGMRIIAIIDPDAEATTRLQSTNLLDVTVSFPELADLGELVEHRAAVLDGEVVVDDENGRSDFGLLQQRMHIQDPGEAARMAAILPVSYHLFDILHLDGHDTTDLPWSDRRRLLESLVEPDPWVDVPGATRADGQGLLNAATERGLEGLVAKRTDSTYRPGTRSPNWLKIKIRRRQELVIGGWTEGNNSRAGTVGAVLVGWYDDDGLHYAGRVGSGLSEAERARLTPRLTELGRATSPFAEPVEATGPDRGKVFHWVEPELVGEIAYGEWSADGRLRHPAWQGLRIDVDPRSVGRQP